MTPDTQNYVRILQMSHRSNSYQIFDACNPEACHDDILLEWIKEQLQVQHRDKSKVAQIAEQTYLGME